MNVTLKKLAPVGVPRVVICAIQRVARRRSVQRFFAVSVAAIAHFFLLACLGAFVLPTIRNSTLTVSCTPGNEIDVLSVVEIQLPVFEPSSVEVGPLRMGHGTTTDWAVDDSTILADVARIGKTLDRPAASANSEVSGTGKDGGNDNSDGADGGDDNETIQGDAAFFGIATDAGRIVYVVDASGSMNFYGRFAQTTGELLDSITRLSPNQEFHVFLFSSHGRVRQFSKEFSTPTPKNVALLRDVLTRFTPTGSTEPSGALRRALQLRPDVIFFLTDGDFETEPVQRVLESENAGTVIHTIALQSRSGEQALQDIAAATNGQYRFVPAP